MKKMLIASAMALSILSVSAQTAKTELQAAQSAYQAGDKSSAVAHLQKAADAGDAGAQYNLSVALGNGDGVAVNQQLALQYLQKSASAGYPPAQYDLALYYLSNKQPAKAAPYLKQLADKGDAASQFNYGMMLLRGDGVKANKKLGKSYIQKAAAQKFPPAQEVLPKLK